MVLKRVLSSLFFVFTLGSFLGCASSQRSNSDSSTNQSSNDEVVDVVIVGAGLSGLSTAYRLQKAGLTYKVIELSPHIGGRIRTASYLDGSSAELGLEEFWEGNPTLEIIKELNLPTEASAASFSSFLYEGNLYAYTQDTNPEFLNSLFQGKELEGFRAWDSQATELYKMSSARPLPQELKKLMKISFADWVKADKRLTKRTREFIRIESEPEFATSWENISALDGILEWHIFAGNGSKSWHIQGGNQKLPEAIASHIGMKNVMLNTKVTRIESTTDGVTVEGVDQGNFEQRRVRGRYVVTTIPLYRLLEMQFLPALTDDRKAAIQTQGWGAYFTAHVTLAPEASKIIDHEILPILSDSELGCIYGPETYQTGKPFLLNLLVSGGHAERFNMRAVTAMDSVRTELSELLEKRWPGVKGLIKKFELHQYHPRAIASWPVGRSRLDEGSDLFRVPQGRVYFAGDYTEGTHSDGAARSAIRVANDIVARHQKAQ